jgi:hypothetical protein
MKTQDALSLLIALEERVARVYFHFFRTFRTDPEMARCWWEMARDEYGHVGLLKMVRDLVPADAEAGQIGSRLWALVDLVERCEQEASAVQGVERALELAVQLETSELDALGHRIVQSVQTELPEGAARPFLAPGDHHRRLVEAAGKVTNHRLRQRLESMLSSARVR